MSSTPSLDLTQLSQPLPGRPNRVRDTNHLLDLRDVVDANDVSAEQNGSRDGGRRAPRAVFYRHFSKRAFQVRFSRRSDEDRALQARQLGQTSDRFEGVRRAL